MSQVVDSFYVFLTLFTAAVVQKFNDRFYPRYHLAPPRGWMGRPCGFNMHRGEHHIFYQFNPNSSYEPGALYWGHAKSVDLFHWEHLPTALAPDQWYDVSGVMSGSFLVENDTIYIFYTGNINHPGEDPDHEQHICFANQYGVAYYKHNQNPVIEGNEHQPNFRDPQIWKYKSKYYIAVGSSYLGNTKGRIILYNSDNFFYWKQVSVLYQSNEPLGYMWESPHLFELDGLYVLFFSPLGMKPDGEKYRNVYQTLYIIGDFDYITHTFVPRTEFKELDHGHDFYAPQTLLDDIGRRILIAWLTSGENSLYPDKLDGFAGCMTVPRELTFGNNHELVQKPLAQTEHARGQVVRRGKGESDDWVVLPDKTGEVIIKAKQGKDVQVIIDSASSKVIISYNAKKKWVTLDRGGTDGIRRAKWKSGRRLHWIIYIDASSVELFCGRGEVTFSSRFFPTGEVYVRLGNNTRVQVFKVSEMQRTFQNLSRTRTDDFLFTKMW